MARASWVSFGSLLGLVLGTGLWFVAPEDQFLALSQETWIAAAAGALLVCAGVFPALLGGEFAVPPSRRSRVGLAGLSGWGILAAASALTAGRFSSGSASGATIVACAALGVWVALGGSRGRHFVAWVGAALACGMAAALWGWAGSFLPRVLGEGGCWRDACAAASFDLESFPLPSKNLAGLVGAMAVAFSAGAWGDRASRPTRCGVLLLGGAGGLTFLASGSEAAAVGLVAGLLGAFARRLGARRSLAFGAAAVLALGFWSVASGLADRHAFRIRTASRAWRVSLNAPWLGHGPGSFHGAFDSPEVSGGPPGEVYALEGSSTRVTHAHVLPLQVAVEGGWPCALALGASVAAALSLRRRDVPGPEARWEDGVRGALAAWAVASLLGMEGSVPIALLWASCGAGLLLVRDPVALIETAVRPRTALPAALRVLLVLAGAGLAYEGGVRPAWGLCRVRALDPDRAGGGPGTPQSVFLPDPIVEQEALWLAHADLGRRPARAVRRIVERRRASPTGSVCFWESQFRMGCEDASGARPAFRRCAGWYGARPDLYDVAFSWRITAPERPDATFSTPRDLWGWLDACRGDPAWREDLLPCLRDGMRIAPDDARLPWLEARILSAVDPASTRASDARAGDLATRRLEQDPEHRPSLWTRAALLRASDPAAAARMLEALCRRFPSDWSFVRLRDEARAAASQAPPR